MKSPWKILRPGPSPGRSKSRCARRTVRFLSTHARKETTQCMACSPAHAPRKRKRNRRRNEKNTELRAGRHWAASRGYSVVGTSRIHRRVRFKETVETPWYGRQGRTDQSAFVDSHRRQESRWHHNPLDDRRRYTEYTASTRLHEGLTSCWN